MSEGKDILRYVDAAMYDAQPMLRDEEDARITPRVFLLSATPDPLGVLAADMRMYRGDPVYSLDELTDEERRWAWDELSKTRLNTPLEGVQLKFMIEGVTRSFTHQMVRQRVGAYYVQESLRFAVKRGLTKECALPPSIFSEQEAFDHNREKLHGEGVVASDVWHNTVDAIQEAYEKLVALGIPAEDARGLLPHCVTTRIIYTTNLRALFEHAGNRLCTQAQFEWRSVFLGIMKAIREYESGILPRTVKVGEDGHNHRVNIDNWQWEIIGTPTPKTFAPVCYKTGKCEFMASLDRGCSIRDRVQAFHEHGVPPDQWTEGAYIKFVGDTVPGTGGERIEGGDIISGIDPAEWMADPTAGMTTETNRPT